MRKELKYLGAGFVLALALYGAVSIAVSFLTESHGRGAAPFVQGMTSAIGTEVKKKLAETPNEKLEEDSEAASRKMYPLVKGAILGQMNAFLNDPNKEEIPKKMREAGKAVSEQIIGPFTEGLGQGSGKVFGSLDSGLKKARKFNLDNKDIIDSVATGLKALQQMIQQNPLPAPETPAADPGPVLPPPYPYPQPDSSPDQR